MARRKERNWIESDEVRKGVGQIRLAHPQGTEKGIPPKLSAQDVLQVQLGVFCCALRIQDTHEGILAPKDGEGM
jgi:hypothetical protein